MTMRFISNGGILIPHRLIGWRVFLLNLAVCPFIQGQTQAGTLNGSTQVGSTPDTASVHVSDSVGRPWKIALRPVTLFDQSLVRQNNSYAFSVGQAKSLVSLVGETDVIRYVGTLPGVAQGMEAALGYYVRGGNNSNNLVELDDVPVYGHTHLFGLFSTLQSDIVESVEFRSGGFSSASGDYLSSVSSIHSLTPDTAAWHVKASVSPYMLGFSVSGSLPTIPLSVVAAGRVSLLRAEYLLFKSLVNTSLDIHPVMSDFFAKAVYSPDAANRFELSGYYSNDYFDFNYINSDIALNWGNQHLRAAWNHVLSDNLKLQTLCYVNRFQSAQQQRYYTSEDELNSELKMQTGLQEELVKSSIHYLDGPWVLQSGLSATIRIFTPAAERLLVGRNSNTSFIDTSRISLLALFAEAAYTTNSLKANLGMRLSRYNNWLSGSADSSVADYESVSAGSSAHWLLDIHGKIVATLGSTTGLELSYDKMTQTSHTLEGLPTGWSIDLVVPATHVLKPESAHQLYVGAFWRRKQWMASAGFFYKHMNHLASYTNAINVFGVQNSSWQDEVVSGQGSGYGLETRLEKTESRWQGALSYTLSKSSRQYDAINGGDWYPFKFDRRHILTLTTQVVTIRKPLREQRLSATVNYSSGHHETIPVAMYEGVELPYWDIIDQSYTNALMNQQVYYRQLMTGVNGYQLPAYFRIDVGYTFIKTGRRFTRELTLGLFNLLNRQNPYLIFHEDGQWKQLSLFPIVPSVKWSLEFLVKN